MNLTNISRFDDIFKNEAKSNSVEIFFLLVTGLMSLLVATNNANTHMNSPTNILIFVNAKQNTLKVVK